MSRIGMGDMNSQRINKKKNRNFLNDKTNFQVIIDRNMLCEI